MWWFITPLVASMAFIIILFGALSFLFCVFDYKRIADIFIEVAIVAVSIIILSFIANGIWLIIYGLIKLWILSMPT